MTKLMICLKSAVIILILFLSSCATTMSLEEAKKVSLAIEEKPFIAPSRRINDVLTVLEESGHFDARATSRMKAEAIAVPGKGANDETLASFYQKRGIAAWQLGYVKQALDDMQNALTYSQKTGRNDPDLLRYLGIAELSCGNFQKAVDLLKQSLQLSNSMGSYDHLISAYIQMGNLEEAQRISDEAINTYDARNKRRQAQRNPQQNNALIGEVHVNRIKSSLLDAQGRYADAERYLRAELDLHYSESVVESIPRFAIANRILLSYNLTMQRRLIEAETEARLALQESLGHGGRESDLTAHATDNLARVMMFQERFSDAEKLARAGIRILESSGISPDSNVMCNARILLGSILSQQENFPQAVVQFDLARSGMQENAYLYETKFARNQNLLLAYLKTGRSDEAMKIITNAYELNRKHFGETHPETMRMLGLRGMANALKGNRRQALHDFAAAVPHLMRKTRIGSDNSNLFHRLILESYADFLIAINGTPQEKELNINAAKEVFKIISYLGVQSTQSALSESSARAAASYSPELTDLVRREQDMQKQTSALQLLFANAVIAPPDQQDAQAIRKLKMTLETLTKARTSLLDEINKRFPRYDSLINPPEATIQTVQLNLHSRETLISIYSTNEKTYTLAVSQKGNIHVSASPLGKRSLATIVNHLRTALDPHPDTLGDIPEFDLVEAFNLYSNILKPVEHAWDNADNLLITVNGPLGQLPFSLLPTKQIKLEEEKKELFAKYRQVPWLIRKASVSMIPSIAALITLRSLPEGDPKRKAFAGFGDPIFNRQQIESSQHSPSTASDKIPSELQLASRGIKMQVRGVRLTEKGNLDNNTMISAGLDKLDRLPDTALELRTIADILGADSQADVFTGKDCSKARILSMNLADRKVISFATHALIAGDLDGLDQPALALSAPAITGEKEGGILTMDEIMKLKLNADWVVLSACNTGAAEGQGSEAISGLGKAFFYAGTKSLLVSMWSVETTSARKLVTGIFQAQLKDKALSRAQALRKAMLNLIDNETLKDEATGKIVACYSHPLFWAPFVMVGDPG